MNQTGRIVVGAVLIVIGGLALVSWIAGRNRETSSESFSGVTEILFDVENAPVDFVAGADDTVVDMNVTTGLFGAKVDLEQSGGTLRLVQDCPWFPFGWACRASFEVTVPAGVEVSGTTSNGALTMIGLEAPVDVETSNGSITATDLSSDAVVRTSNGTISATGLASNVFQARSSNGSIDLAFAEAPASVRVDTSNGSVEVILPSDSPPYALTTSTSNGTVATEVRSDPSAPDSIDIETSNGDITVRYPG